jgi:hypothetical protein
MRQGRASVLTDGRHSVRVTVNSENYDGSVAQDLDANDLASGHIAEVGANCGDDGRRDCRLSRKAQHEPAENQQSKAFHPASYCSLHQLPRFTTTVPVVPMLAN